MSDAPSTSHLPHSHTDPENPGGFHHIPALDGIRGLAIIMVLVIHFFWSNPSTGSHFFNTLNAICSSMWIGVSLFFALSGFLITGILWDTVRTPHFFRNFYLRRILRIFPLYYGALLFLFAVSPLLHLHWNGWQLSYLTYTSNITLAVAARPGPDLGHFEISHFWSLQVEEQFYLLWPLFIYKVRNLRRALVITACLWSAGLAVRLLLEAFHAPLSNPYIIYSPTFSCADDIVIGAFLALLLRTSARRQVLRRAPLVFVLAAVPLLLMGIANHGLSFLTSKLVATVGISLLGIAFTALIAMSLVPASLTQRVFSNPFLRQFGRYSYGIYVFHSSIARFLTRPLRQFFNGHFHSKPFAVLAPVIILTALTFALAVASYHLIEVRFLHLKRFFQYRRPRIS